MNPATPVTSQVFGEAANDSSNQRNCPFVSGVFISGDVFPCQPLLGSAQYPRTSCCWFPSLKKEITSRARAWRARQFSHIHFFKSSRLGCGHLLSYSVQWAQSRSQRSVT